MRSVAFKRNLIDDDDFSPALLCRTAHDRSVLISACAQRVQQRLAKILEGYNADRMQGNYVTLSFSMAPESASECVSILTVLSRLMAMPGSGCEHAVLLVSERLPSTLVKLLKAMTPSDSSATISTPLVAMTAMMQNLLMLTLEFLGEVTRYEEVLQELIESSTMHRLFHLSFHQARPQQLAILLVRFHRIILSSVVYSRQTFKLTVLPVFLLVG